MTSLESHMDENHHSSDVWKNTEILQSARPSRSTLASTWTSTPTSSSTIKWISTSTAKVHKWEEGIYLSPSMAKNLKMGGPKNPRKYQHFGKPVFFFTTLSKSRVTWYFLSTHSFYNSNSIWWVGLSVCARGVMFIEEEDSKKGRVQLDFGWSRENVSLEDVGVVRRYLLQIIWGSKKGEHGWQISGRLQLTNDLRTSSHLHWIPALAECKWKDKDKLKR